MIKNLKLSLKLKKKRIGKYYSEGFVPTHTVDRAVAIIKKKQPYIDWIRNLPDSDNDSTLESINDDPSCYLIPTCGDTIEDIVEHLKAVSSEIFEMEMNGWWTEEGDWEKDLSWENFQKWFDFEISSFPIDLGEDEIYREEY